MTSEPDERPIADYALIGDTRTAALVSSLGSIDWMCVPAFDGEPLFGRLIGGDDSGSFSISIEGLEDTHRSYRGHSAVLDSSVRSTTGAGRLTEAMVVDVEGALLPQLILIRTVRCDEGSLNARVLFDPRLGLPGASPRVGRRAGVLVCEWGSIALALQTSQDLDVQPGREFTVEVAAGSSLSFVMTLAHRSPVVFISPERAEALVDDASGWWRDWIAETDYQGPFVEHVLRSLITLQLLTFAPSGAPVAAPTTSLPEVLGGDRNWDYRYSW
ncbi:MAG TPA: trehalase-like domain-containing protein, partial [Actinomycetota bacterium]|nr:trehalase-like domain-containing protein [Actinomycetota bacterium]